MFDSRLLNSRRPGTYVSSIFFMLCGGYILGHLGIFYPTGIFFYFFVFGLPVCDGLIYMYIVLLYIAVPSLLVPELLNIYYILYTVRCGPLVYYIGWVGVACVWTAKAGQESGF